MAELFLKFKDVDTADKRVRVDNEKFSIGRHSSNDLAVVDGRLSRRHLSIERFGDVFVVSDSGSSNGSKLNGEPLLKPVALKPGDILDLGGLLIETDFEGLETVGGASAPDHASSVDAPPPAADHVVSAPASTGGSIPLSVFLIAPIVGIVVIGFAAGIYFLTRGTKPANDIADSDEFQYSDKSADADDKPEVKSAARAVTETVPQAQAVGPAASTQNAGSAEASQPAQNQPTGETAKIEQNGGKFLRSIAQNDPTAFMTAEQTKAVATRIKQLSGSTSLAANINSARQNAGQIKTLASALNLKPQFLAVAAINRLGSSRGDVAGTARSMSETLEKLRTQLGGELADDTLMMIAAYDQGAAGESMKLRNALQDLATKFPESSRSIRSVWFLQKNGKITQAEFEHAVTFLAIGTITQNPKEFGVNAEALNF